MRWLLMQHVSITCEEVNKTSSLQPSGCNGLLVFINAYKHTQHFSILMQTKI